MKLRIEPDMEPTDPREFDNIGTMVCFHKRYKLGDKHDLRSGQFDGWEELRAYIENELGGICILPLYLMDHSGLAMRSSPEEFRAADSAGWDWGQVGFIYTTSKKVDEAGASSFNIEKALESEVEAYSQYLSGDVWGYIIEDSEGEVVDSCWGFFGRNYAESEGQEALARIEKEMEE